MHKVLLKKLREAFVSVLPVTAIVFLLSLTPVLDLTGRELAVFLVSSLFLILGIGLFSLGADVAMTPMGEQVGSGLTRTRNVPLLLLVAFGMGFLITVAEPDLSVLASQVEIENLVLIVTVGVGVGIFLLLAVVKMLFRKPLSSLLLFFYMALFAMAALLLLNGGEAYLAMSFDAGGVTTGPITVPFIMALGVGIAATIGGREVGENSFGLIAMCSVGPILAVLILGLFSGESTYTLPAYSIPDDLLSAVSHELLKIAKEVGIALGLIIAFFAVLQIFCLHLSRQKLLRIAVGILFTFLGLVIFLAADAIGFQPIGYKMGTALAGQSPIFITLFGFLLGAVVVLAEPAVQVLNRQVEEITGGSVSRRSMMIALSIGVGLSLALSMLRIIYDFNILYYLIPGYLISLGLSFFVPGLYTAIAFDSGGVASGPLTSSFILPFAIGVCYMLQGEGKIMEDAFGIVAMVAMTPLITIQLLGFRAVVASKVRRRIAMRRILGAEDEQIIRFR